MSPVTVESLRQASVAIGAGVSLLGQRYEDLPEWLRRLDRERGLALASLLAATPPRWVWLPGFAIGRRLVTNGEYLQFLSALSDPQGDPAGPRVFDEPEVWRYVWADMNARIGAVRVSEVQSDGTVRRFEENYSDARSFIEAYLASLGHEVDRVLLDDDDQIDDGSGEVRTRRVTVHQHKTVRRVFAYLKWRLRRSIVAGGSDDPSELLPDEQDQDLLRQLLGQETPGAAIQTDIDSLVRDLSARYLPSVDRRYLAGFRQGNRSVETVAFFRRARREVATLPEEAALPLHRLLFPRTWSAPGGDEARAGFGAVVPWADRPVAGVTLYEALAYAAWLSRAVEGRIEVALPNEAEYERAAGWPLAGTGDSGGNGAAAAVADPRRKQVYPWQERSEKEFFDFFGSEGRELENYLANRKGWDRLVEETARLGPDGARIAQLVGFGWQWTIDRFDSRERKYARFAQPDYPRHVDPAEVRSPEGASGPEPGRAALVFAYAANCSPGDSYYVVRGSPDVIGGPGLVTRRFALSPLRGYPNVSFRWVLHD